MLEGFRHLTSLPRWIRRASVPAPRGALGECVPPARQTAHRLRAYPSWFWLPAAPATGARFGQEARQALLDAWETWAVVLDGAIADPLKSAD